MAASTSSHWKTGTIRRSRYTAFSPTFSGQGLFVVPLVASIDGRIELELIGALPQTVGVLDALALTRIVPKPGTALLLAAGVAALAQRRRTLRHV